MENDGLVTIEADSRRGHLHLVGFRPSDIALLLPGRRQRLRQNIEIQKNIVRANAIGAKRGRLRTTVKNTPEVHLRAKTSTCEVVP
jgi:hypothetical protein